MCVYSMIAGDWMNPWSPNRIPVPNTPVIPIPNWPYVPLPTTPPPESAVKPEQVTPEIAKLMLEILEKVDKLDKKLGLVDCKLNEKEKEQYQAELRKIAKTTCPCKPKKKVKKKSRRAKVSGQASLDRVPGGRGQLLQE